MGPISHTGPKTSRAARDRPELNPRRNQTSRHDIARATPERRPAGDAATKNMRAARAHAVSRDAAPSSRATSRTISQPARRERRFVRPPSATIMRPANIVAREERRNDPATRRAINAIGYPRMSASGESSTTMHRLLHASGSHPIPTPYDPNNQYNQDLGLIHSTNGNHLESSKEGSSIDHQVTIYLHAQNITMFPTNETCTCVTLNGSGIQLAVGPQPLWLRNHNFEHAQRIMVKRLATSRHDPPGITDSACKNQLVVVSVQYGPFNPYIPIRSTTIGKSRVAKDPIAMHTSWRSK
ncbi:exportin-1-like [Dorcoceras hygrometricum]|uniref:Exportin-1-like n=1 Tax=Dorcoceras hygrometricum TaxID=472368 RepID=A0A2Z7BY57_9LAMI|nr:exportin-1-like [Dorcoceras hygrometricum]